MSEVQLKERYDAARARVQELGQALELAGRSLKDAQNAASGAEALQAAAESERDSMAGEVAAAKAELEAFQVAHKALAEELQLHADRANAFVKIRDALHTPIGWDD